MKKYTTILNIFLMLIISLASINAQKVAEVDLVNGVWISTVNGEIVYQGDLPDQSNLMFDAINSACLAVGSGSLNNNNIININDTGGSGRFDFSEDSPSRARLGDNDVYGIYPESFQTLDFHNNRIHCENVEVDFDESKNHIEEAKRVISEALVVGVTSRNKQHITIKNIEVTGNPRYGLWFLSSNNITLTNITMNLSRDLFEEMEAIIRKSDPEYGRLCAGIRVAPTKITKRYKKEDTFLCNDLRIDGEICINGSNGHGIETYGVKNVTIGDVSVTNTGGCGILLNNSHNCNLGVITGYKNSENGDYATLRVANTNHKTRCKGIYSRNSGKGFFSISESSDCIVEEVDIQNSRNEAIYIQNSINTHVLSGITLNGGRLNSINNVDDKRIDPDNKDFKHLDGIDGYFNSIYLDERYACAIIQEEDPTANNIEDPVPNNYSGSIDSDNKNYTGTGFINTENKAGASIEWDVDGGVGTYTFKWRYANGQPSIGAKENRTADLYIDNVRRGSVNFNPTSNWDTWAMASITISGINSGVKKIRLKANRNSGLANIDCIQVIRPKNDTIGSAVQIVRIQELEKGFYTVTEGSIEKHPSYTGYGYALANGITWYIEGGAGDYTFRWRYANGSRTNRTAVLKVDRVEKGTRNFEPTGGWSKFKTTSITVKDLGSGIKSVFLGRLQNEGLAAIDYLEVTGPGVRGALRVQSHSFTQNGTSSHKTLVSDLATNTVSVNEKRTVYIYDLTGKFIQNQTFTSSEDQINTKGLSEGIYIIKIEGTSTIETAKIYINP